MIREATKNDAQTIAGMAILMWDSHAVEDLADEFVKILSRDDAQIFLKYENDIPVGFAQCQLRHDYVEGTHSSPVGYLEGIFVRPEYRHQGRARALLAACQQWAKKQGCTEFASDCGLGNHGSLAFHLKMGFMEANRIICFTKKI